MSPATPGPAAIHNPSQSRKIISVESIRPQLQGATKQAPVFIAMKVGNGARARPEAYLQESSLMPTHQRHQAQQQSSVFECAVERSPWQLASPWR